MDQFESLAPLGGTELHTEVSLSKILNPRIAPDVQLVPYVAATVISKGPAMSWQLIQGVPWPSPMSTTGFGPSKPRNPHGKKRKRKRTNKCILTILNINIKHIWKITMCASLTTCSITLLWCCLVFIHSHAVLTHTCYILQYILKQICLNIF